MIIATRTMVHPSTSRLRAAIGVCTTKGARLAGAFAYVLLVLGPGLALCIGLSRIPPATWPDLLVPRGRRLDLLWRSGALAAAVALGAMATGSLAALRLMQWRGRARATLRWLILMFLPFPAVTHAQAWAWLAGQFNRLLQRQGMMGILFYGWGVSWWVQMLWLMPIAIGLALVAFESVDPALVEAGRMHHAGHRVLTHVVFPLAMPLLLAGAGVIFVLSLVDYAVPSLFQVNVYALEVFADFSAHNQPGRALLLAVPLLVTTVAVALLSQARLRPAALSPSWRQVSPVGQDQTGWLVTLAQGALIVVALGMAVPLVSLALQLGPWSHFAASVSAAGPEIGYTLRVALVTALLSLPLAYCAARGALQQRYRWLWWLAITAPLAVPGPLIGIGLIGIWNSTLGHNLAIYGSSVMPVLASLARYTPFGALVLVATLRRLNPSLLEAARVLRPGGLRTWLWVSLPLHAPGLAAAYGLVFCLTLCELSATLLVAAPGQGTLSLRIYNYLHYGASDTVAGLTLVLTMLVLAPGVVAFCASALVFRRNAAPRLLAQGPSHDQG